MRNLKNKNRYIVATVAGALCSTVLTGVASAQEITSELLLNTAGDNPGNFSGTGSVVIDANAVSLSGINTYSGTTTIRPGAVLDVTSPTNASLSSNSAFIVDGTLGGGAFASNQTIGSLAGASTGLVNTQGFTLTAGGDNSSTTFAGTFGGTSGGFTKVGTGTLTLSGTGSALTGNLATEAGNTTLTGSLTAATATVSDGATLFVGSATTSGALLTAPVTNAGTFRLFADNNSAGNFANAGTAEISGSLVGDFDNNASGTLSGTGTITGNGTNSGSIRPGDGAGASPGVLNIDGSYTQTATGTYFADVYGAGAPVAGTHYDQIAVSGTPGTATLAGNLVVVANPNTLYVDGAQYDVLTATGGITGSMAISNNVVSPFITLSNSAAGTGVVSTGATAQAYRLMVDRTDYAVGIGNTATGNQLATATAFQGLVSGATGDTASVVIGVDNMTAAQARSFFDQVGPESYGAYATALSSMGELFTRQVALQLHETPSTVDGVSIWGRGYGQWGNGKNRGGNFGTDQDIYGGALGLDFRSGGGVLGLAGGYSHDKLEYRPGNSKGKGKSWQAGAYGGYAFGPIDFDLQAAYIHGKFDATKTINVATLLRTADANFSGNLWKIIGTVGWKADLGAVTLRPFVGVDYSDGKVKSFTETGAGAANLTVERIKIKRTDLLVGVDLGANSTSTISPYARLAYRYGLKKRDRFISASFDNDPTTAFTVSGVRQGRSEFDVDAGLSLAISPRASLFAGYQGTFRNDLKGHGVSAGFRFSLGGQEVTPPSEPAPPTYSAPPPPPPPPPPPVVECNKGPYIVFFDWDRSDLTPEAATVLDNAVTAYGNCASVPIMLAGHADRSGSAKYNEDLSERRNVSVRNYLTSHGVSGGAITSQAFGESMPRVPTADGVRELQNRRVEITYGPGSGN